MAIYKYQEFINRHRVGEFPSLICLLGSDLYLRGQLVDMAAERFGPGKKVERENFYATESSPENVLASSQTCSMFAERKIILVHQFQAWPQNQRAVILGYLEKPSPDTILILIADDPPADYYEKLSYGKWFKSASSKIEVVDIAGLRAEEVREIIKEMAKSFEKRITPEAVDLLLETIGPRPELVCQELAKISLYLASAKLISPELVSELTIGSKLQNIFELAEALGKKDIDRSLNIYHRMYEQNPVSDAFWFLGILAIVRRQFRIMLELQAALGAEQTVGKIAGRYNIPYALRGEYEQLAERFDKKRLLEVFDDLHQTELEIKSSAHEKNIIIESLIMRLCQP